MKQWKFKKILIYLKIGWYCRTNTTKLRFSMTLIKANSSFMTSIKSFWNLLLSTLVFKSSKRSLCSWDLWQIQFFNNFQRKKICNNSKIKIMKTLIISKIFYLDFDKKNMDRVKICWKNKKFLETSALFSGSARNIFHSMKSQWEFKEF